MLANSAGQARSITSQSGCFNVMIISRLGEHAMAQENIERFDRNVGMIFAELYKSFPQRIPMDVNVARSTREEDFHPDQLDEYFADVAFFEATMNWLIEAGNIWCRPPSDLPTSVFFDCCLSIKGLESLKAIPDALTGESLGSQLQSAAKSGLLDTVKSLSGKALSVGATMGYSAVTAWTAS